MSAAAIIPFLTLVSHFLFVVILLHLIFRKTWGRTVAEFVGRHAIALGLLMVVGAILGSLYYSEVAGFLPCELCWWQRVAIYPQFILFLTALKFKARSVFAYSWRLSLLAAIVALYQIYAQSGGKSLLGCTATGGACLKVYVLAYGYITIPVMGFTIAAYLLLLAWANKVYEDSHA
jgi:disulfide bond formation protein DsbB